MSIPKDIRYDLARAQGYLQKNDFPMALESIAMALRHISSQHIHSVSTVERHINAFLTRICTQPTMVQLLDPYNSGATHNIEYQYGKEGALITVLREFAKILRDKNQKQEEFYEKRERLQDLLQKGLSLIEEGQIGTGASFLQRAAKEYSQEEHTIASIGQALLHYSQYAMAAKVYHDSLRHHPKNKNFYSQAIKAYVHAEDFAGAIHVFHRALQQFGRHPRSIAKLAELYILWDKEEEAELLAQEALTMDSNENLAQDILMAIEDRKEARELEILALEEEQQRQELAKRTQAARDEERLSLEPPLDGSHTEDIDIQTDLSPQALEARKQHLALPQAWLGDYDQDDAHKEEEEEENDFPPLTEKDMVQGLAQDVLLSFQDVGSKKRV